MGEDYLVGLMRLVDQSGHFPQAGYVLNSSEGRDLDRIARFFERLLRARPQLSGRLTSGYDRYPFIPRPRRATSVGDLVSRAHRALRPWAEARKNIRRASRSSYGYRIEVTEAQAEPWGTERSPGNSLPHFQHVLAECIHEILNPDQDESVIRMWGIEYQLAQVLQGNGRAPAREILRLVGEINAVTQSPGRLLADEARADPRSGGD
jgi:hypothetical protein